jgi:hypothetical protein
MPGRVVDVSLWPARRTTGSTPREPMNFMMDCCCELPASPGIAPLLGDSSMVKSSALSCVSWISRADGDPLLPDSAFPIRLPPAGTAPKRSCPPPSKFDAAAPPPTPSKSVPPPAAGAAGAAAPQLPKTPPRSAVGASRDGGCCASGCGAVAPPPSMTPNPAGVCCACTCANPAGKDCCCSCGCAAVKLANPAAGSGVAAGVTVPNPAGGGG